MKNGKIINLVKEEYRINRTRAAEIADAKLSAAMKNEDFAKITREISALNFEIAFAKAHNNDTSAKEKELRLAFEKRAALLKKMKMSEKDFEPVIRCPACRDAGIVNGRFCQCFKTRYYEVLADYLDIGQMPRFGFDDADFSEIRNAAQRKKLESNYKIFKKYAEKYPDVKYKNAVIMGGTGVGKSYLTAAVANAMKKKGLGVIYISAIQLDRLMLLYHTSLANERDVYLADIIDCDFLVIDDLGSEQKIKNVTDEYLLKILDERETNNKPVFVTTNLNIDQLRSAYNERLFSRLTNINRTILSNIDGDDLRLN